MEGSAGQFSTGTARFGAFMLPSTEAFTQLQALAIQLNFQTVLRNCPVRTVVARSDTMALEGTGVNLWKTQEVSYSETLGNST
jgi:hypothetical protein